MLTVCAVETPCRLVKVAETDWMVSERFEMLLVFTTFPCMLKDTLAVNRLP